MTDSSFALAGGNAGFKGVPALPPLPAEPRSDLPLGKRNWALFLDVDGTLIELAATAEAVVVPPRLRPILFDLAEATGGALALVSGRPIRDLDRLFAPLILPAAGQHGLERRTAQGDVIRQPVNRAVLAGLIDGVTRFAARRPGLRVEIKSMAVALHFRQQPALGPEAELFVRDLVALEGPGFHVQPGKMVWEIKPAAGTKGSALETFMAEQPFTDRVPVYLGDDLTDEDGFRAAHRFGGISIQVATPGTGNGPPTAARWRIRSVTAAVDWLMRLAGEIRAG